MYECVYSIDNTWDNTCQYKVRYDSTRIPLTNYGFKKNDNVESTTFIQLNRDESLSRLQKYDSLQGFCIHLISAQMHAVFLRFGVLPGWRSNVQSRLRFPQHHPPRLASRYRHQPSLTCPTTSKKHKHDSTFTWAAVNTHTACYYSEVPSRPIKKL